MRVVQELPEAAVVLPETWFSVTETWVADTLVYYRFGPPMPLREEETGRYRRDDRGRVALEAFLALPIATMYARLASYNDSLREHRAPTTQEGYRQVWDELLAFIDVFGPFGFEWSRIHLVENAEADRLIDEKRRLALEAQGLGPGFEPPKSRATPAWAVRLPPPGAHWPGQVERRYYYPGLSWEERVRLGDDRIFHDDLGLPNIGTLASTHAALAHVIRVTEALDRGKPLEVRKALEGFPRYPAFWVGGRPMDSSLAPDWRTAMKGMVPSDGWFKPYQEHETHVDWIELGRNIVAEHFRFELAGTSIGVGRNGGKLALGWLIGSLIEVMYLQLFEHLDRRSDFGIGTCGVCNAPILRVRRCQRWHSGCAPAGRQREFRAARKRQSTGAGTSRIDVHS